MGHLCVKMHKEKLFRDIDTSMRSAEEGYGLKKYPDSL